MNEGFKEDEGRYFTPVPITRFIWNALPFETLIDTDKSNFPKVLDFACGSGHFLTDKTKYPYPKRGEVLISAAGTLGKAVIFDGGDAYFQDSNIVWIDNNQARVSNVFLYVLCVNAIDWQKAGTRGGIIGRLYNDNIRAIQIPLPPLEAQQQILTAIKSFESIAQNMEVKMQNLESKKAEILDHFLNT